MPPALKKPSRARLLFRVVLHDKTPQISKHCGFHRAMIRGALRARVLLIAEQGGWRIVHIHLLPFAEHANLVNVFRVFGDPVDAFDMRTGANGRYLHGALPSDRTTAPALADTIRRPASARESRNAFAGVCVGV